MWGTWDESDKRIRRHLNEKRARDVASGNTQRHVVRRFYTTWLFDTEMSSKRLKELELRISELEKRLDAIAS